MGTATPTGLPGSRGDENESLLPNLEETKEREGRIYVTTVQLHPAPRTLNAFAFLSPTSHLHGDQSSLHFMAEERLTVSQGHVPVGGGALPRTLGGGVLGPGRRRAQSA